MLIEALLSEDAGKAYCTEFKGPVPANLAAQKYFILPDQPPKNQEMLMKVTDHVRVPMFSPYDYVVEQPFFQELDNVAQGKETVPEAMAKVCTSINEALAAEVEKVKSYSG
jgi:maltose-binding protein MalE